MAMPNPIPVLIVSSRCLSDARMLSRSSVLILPRATSRSINSTMALQRSVAFISGMICSAESRLAKDMQYFPCGGRKLNVGLSDDKRVLAFAPLAQKALLLTLLILLLILLTSGVARDGVRARSRA